ncbi:unnamed protein product [Sphagnum troendelagicum]|uniref:Uncharacterized protein n=1 Tax=Sphagnum troendelagicum TaxID=128251 RepID=A0ABP0UKZ5_9BRYO
MVYHKGLPLSSAGRQSHGVGNIVSYMSTDSIYLLHNTWVLPLQLLLAMGVLSCSVGTAAIAGFGVLVIVAASSLLVAQKQQLCQVQALVSVQRLKKFMQSDELQDDAIEQQVYVPGLEADMVAAVYVEDGCFKWELELELPAFNHINIKIEKGSFVGIVGMVVSGKFTIPASLLGEVPRITGRGKTILLVTHQLDFLHGVNNIQVLRDGEIAVREV